MFFSFSISRSRAALSPPGDSRESTPTTSKYEHRLTNKDTAPGLGFEDDVHWIVDSVKPFLILVHVLRVDTYKPSDDQ